MTEPLRDGREFRVLAERGVWIVTDDELLERIYRGDRVETPVGEMAHYAQGSTVPAGVMPARGGPVLAARGVIEAIGDGPPPPDPTEAAAALLTEHGLQAAAVKPYGRITLDDVRAHVKAQEAAASDDGPETPEASAETSALQDGGG